MKSAGSALLFAFLTVQVSTDNAYCQAQTSAAAGNSVTVQVLQLIDSTKAANGARFNGRTVNAVTTAQGTIAAGTAAVVTLVETSVAGVNAWALQLVSPVQGTVSSLAGAVGNVGGKVNAVSSQLSGLGLPRGLGSLGKKNAATQNPPAAANTTIATQGARVYVPANTQVQFALNQGAGNSAVPTQVSQAPAQAQPAALLPNQATGQPAAPAASSAFVQPAAGTPASAAANSTTTTQTGSSTVVWANVQYVLQGCQRQAPHIVCQVQLTNLGAGDANLAAGRNSYYVDQAGNRVSINAAGVANCNLFAGCLALSGLPMMGSFVFIDEDSKSTQLVRLQIQARNGPVQFTNVPVK